jgi:hypothetical protein
MSLQPAFSSTARGQALQGDALVLHFDKRSVRYEDQCRSSHWNASELAVQKLEDAAAELELPNLRRSGLIV